MKWTDKTPPTSYPDYPLMYDSTAIFMVNIPEEDRL